MRSNDDDVKKDEMSFFFGLKTYSCAHIICVLSPKKPNPNLERIRRKYITTLGGR